MSSSEAPIVWHHYSSLEHQQETTTWGMWVFLATEVMVFGALFTGYTVYRLNYSASFEAASAKLYLPIGAINTVVLLTSSLTMAMAVVYARLGHRRAITLCLLATTLLGVLFLGLKAVEYYIDYREHLVPGLAFDPAEWTADGVHPGKVQLFLMFYYCMTGLHAVHLVIGIGIIGILAFFAARGRFTAQYNSPVEMWGLYWHFVDIVWIFLLPLLYLVGVRTSWQ
jgi:cytochrome c oxidase subunit 3